ncbi:FAD binding domain-containing protein [Tepidiforma bonchosmolovskayae]|uniref:Xanthine dehydrogenase family protein subunit M n=1 Tax=Tepidiforma bonchosmolovskayae TaxID=2601677 RepID=A0ABX6C449_9CHLR|nr:xanthine dehydrogenase family protein subunit M [Tepidiforma bonchosmolovskayae]QFG03810.1 xanthine dehydrogenase family protein subunit M [Tepidiforma bonchosmolovskayae]
MHAFDYARPGSLAEALALASNGRRALFLAGGTDVIVQLREGRRSCDLLIDLKHVPELTSITVGPSGALEIGAAVALAEIYEHPVVRRDFPALVDAASIIGGIAIQSRATLGGNLCNASPAADSSPALMALGATLRIAGPAGERTLPVADFFVGPGQNALQPGEILVSVRIPPLPPRSAAFYHRFIPRNEMDIAVASSGVCFALDDAGRIADARVALGAVAPTPILVPAARDALLGREPGAEAFAAAGEAARAAARPIDDMRGSVAQRRHLAGVLTVRALENALRRIRGAQ